MTDDIDRIAARQRAIRAIGAQIAGRLAHLAEDAERVGLEPQRTNALHAARAIMEETFGLTMPEKKS